MAGIAFQLEKFFKQTGVISTMKGCFFALFVASGPWIMSILTIAIITIFARKNLSMHQLYLLRCSISYTISFSLILFGLMEMPLTRFLADKLYLKDFSAFRGLYVGIVSLAACFCALLGYLFYSFFDFQILFKIFLSVFFFSSFIIWVSMIFLSAGKDYVQITMGFFFGCFFALVLSFIAGAKWSVQGYVAGLALGYSLVAIVLAIRIFLEFERSSFFPWDFFDYFKKYRVLVFVGVSYYIGMWVDKYIFWYYPSVGMQVESLFYTNLHYDTATFFAHLTIVPSLTFFMVKVETDFFRKYLYYFAALDRKMDLYVIKLNENEMIESLKAAINPMVKLQTVISIAAIYFAEHLFEFFHLSSLLLPIFRYAIIGSYLQVLFLSCNIILLYFEFYSSVLFHYTLFVVGNIIFTFVSIRLGVRFHGIGYALSAFFTLMATLTTMNRKLPLITLRTFMMQPLSKKQYMET